jgi:hypothetical protein
LALISFCHNDTDLSDLDLGDLNTGLEQPILKIGMVSTLKFKNY